MRVGVSKRADLNLIQSIKSRTSVVKGGDMIENSNYVVFTIGMDSQDGHLNGAICLDDRYSEEMLQAAEEYFESLQKSYAIWVRGNENSRLESLLKQRGYSPRREPGSAAMVIDARIEGIELKEGYSLKRVETEADRLDLAKVVSETFEKDLGLANHMFSEAETANSDDVIAYIIYDADRPVASAITTISGDTAGIYWVGVVEAKRREGLGAYIVQASTNAGFDRGAKEVILQASEVGEHLYNKLGYKTFKRYRLYPIAKLER